MVKVHIDILVMLGDALEGQGERASARQNDKLAMAMWDEIEPKRKSLGFVLSALRREGIDFLREGKSFW